MRVPPRAALLVLFSLGVMPAPVLFAGAGRPVPAPADPPPASAVAPSSVPAPAPKDGRFDAVLGHLALAVRDPAFASAWPAGEPFPFEALPDSLRSAVDAGLLRIDPDGSVQVYIHTGQAPAAALDADALASLAGAIESLGCRLEAADAGRGIVQARVPALRLEPTAALRGVRYIGLPRYAVSDTGSRLTAGDAILAAARARSEYGVDGTGVTVGVISDGIYGLQTAIDLGDLPGTTFSRYGGKLVGTSGGITSVSFRADGDLEAALGAARGAEGVALLEIIHDLAPKAALYFANFSTDLEFNQAVDFLAQRCDVVVDDISFFGGPYDGSSAVSANAAAALNDPDAKIRAFFTSAGNRALDHYEEPYEPSALDGEIYVGSAGRFHRFGPTAATSDAFAQGPQSRNLIYLYRYQSATIVLSWNDPPYASSNDYDMFLFRSATGALVAASGGAQDGTQEPLEMISFTNKGPDGFFELRVQNYLDLAQPRVLEIFVLEQPFRTVFPNRATLACNTMAGSIAMMGDAGGGVISVGAINAADPGADAIEEYSSRGPTNDGRLKPEIASVDGVAVTGAGGFPVPFYGTSASAPHAAGAAALLLQMAPCLQGAPGDADAPAERALLRQVILDNAIDLGDAGPDQDFGYGRNDVFAAATPMLPVPDVGPEIIAAECVSPGGADVTLDGSGSRAFAPTCPLIMTWTGPFGTIEAPAPTVRLPLGGHDVALDVSQNGGVTRVATRQIVNVRDTVAPALAGDARPALLWPPDHRLQSVVTGVSALDACDASPAVALTGAYSDEPDDAAGNGDGQTTLDIQDAAIGTPDAEVMLRAERDGRGAGRTYAIHYLATDASGNAAQLELTVRAPHDAGALSPSGPEPMILELPDAFTMRWDEVPGARRYQVVRGTLDRAAIQVTPGAVSLGPVVCLVSGPAWTVADLEVPIPGAVFFYLGRYDLGEGFTGFGTATGAKDLQVDLTPCR